MIEKNKNSYKAFKYIYNIYLSHKINTLEKFNNFNHNEPFLIFSDPRGGSTWLAELLSLIPKTAVIWEPLNLTEKKQI